MKMNLLVVLSLLVVSAAPMRSGVPPTPRVADRLSVCVYCGASTRADSKYAQMARQVGERLARRQWTLVWGGGQTGLMGAVASGAKESGGRIVGIIPQFIRQWEGLYNNADEMMVVTTMAERKLLLQVRSDAFVVLPGGIGTLDEIWDTIDLKNLSQHSKPVILLNQDGYYDSLLAFLDHSIAEKFSRDEARGQIEVVRSIDELFTKLEEIDRSAAR